MDELHRGAREDVAGVAGPDQALGDGERAPAHREREARVGEHGGERRVHRARLVDATHVDAVEAPERADEVDQEPRRVARDLGAATVEVDRADLPLARPVDDVAATSRADVELAQHADEVEAEANVAAEPAARHAFAEQARARRRNARSPRSGCPC